MFEFGWTFWIMFFVIFFVCGRICGWGARRCADRRRRYKEDDGQDEHQLHGAGSRRGGLETGTPVGDRLVGDAMTRQGGARTHETAGLKRRRETPMQRLQRKFVDGRITLEEYERELDHLDRLD